MAIYLSLATQGHIFLYLNIMCGISTMLNLIGLIFLLKETPPNQAIIRNYLLIIQVLLLMSLEILEIGCHGIPLFPELAGYATGLLIQLGVSLHHEFSIVVIFYAWIGFSILNCIVFRHQSILLAGHPLKLKDSTCRLIQCLLIMVPTIPFLLYAFREEDAAKVERYLTESKYNLTWVRSRGSYFVEKRAPSMTGFFIFIIFCLVFGTFSFIVIFLHMLHVLRKDSAKRSLQCVQSIRRSLIALFFQLVVPLMLYVLPTVTMFLGLVIENFISFEVCLVMFLILPLHSIGHNVILLTITPSYRKIIQVGLKEIVELPAGLLKHQSNKISGELNGGRNQS